MTPSWRSRWQALRARLAEPRDIAALVAFRIAFGAIITISSLRFLTYGWIHDLFVAPSFRFSYWGFGWLPAPSAEVTYALFDVMAVLGVLVALGFCYRVAAALLFICFTYLQLLDVATYLNHYYLVSLLAGLLFFIPAHRAFSIDALLRPRIRAASLPAWCTYLLRFQVGVVYVNAGLAKATADWLLHAQPLNIWLSTCTGVPIIGPYLDSPAVAYVAAWSGFLFDTSVAFFLSWRKTRVFAYVAVLGFHYLTRIFFPNIGMFPVIMVVSALVFFDSSWPRRFAGQMRRRRLALPPTAEAQAAAAAAVPVAGRWLGLGTAAAGVFVVLQVLLPLRSHFYGGNVAWHEQGMRFSWRVMARAKSGSLTFVVRDPATGREWQVSPAKYLTRTQEREMVVQPDLILKLAHHIARDFEAHGHPGVEVHADARASLNGRPAAVLIDPSADLAREVDSLSPKWWIRPAPQGAPPLLHPVGSRTL
jgi:vitamin K-dependent gamma-carboxylase